MTRAEIARQDAQDARHDDRCPNCGRYVEAEADGFYDREWPYHETAQVWQFCDEACADQKRAKDAEATATTEKPQVPRGTLKG